MKNKTEVGATVWKSFTNYLIYGTVREIKMEAGWLLFRIDWDIPHADFEVEEWQRAGNVGLNWMTLTIP